MDHLTPKQIAFVEAQPLFFVVSCGSGVPVMKVESIRADTELEPWYVAMSEAEQHDYWQRKNLHSIDGLPTGIFEDVR